jgi:hypothetical protein
VAAACTGLSAPGESPSDDAATSEARPGADASLSGGDRATYDGSADVHTSQGNASSPADAPVSSSDAPLEGTSGDEAPVDVDACVPVTGSQLRPVCPSASSCGNGHVDAPCTPQGWSSDSGAVTIEQCDGVDLNCQSCASLGYSGGTVTCTSSCTFDVGSCLTCVSGSKTSCGLLSTPDWSDGLYLAASDTEIGLALAGTYTGAESGSDNHLIRVAKDFTVLSDTVFSTPTDVFGLASTSSGWLVAGLAPLGVSLAYFDSTGAAENARDVAIFASDAEAQEGSSLVAQPNGGALLLWGDMPVASMIGDGSGTFHAQVLAADGTSIGAEASFSGASWASGAFVGDGFEVVLQVGPSSKAELAHIGLDGTVRDDPTIGPGFATPQMLASGTEADVVLGLGGGTNSLYLQRVAQGGSLVGYADIIPTFPNVGIETPTALIAIEGDGIVGWSLSGGAADLDRVSGSGEIIEGGAAPPGASDFSIPVVRSGSGLFGPVSVFQGADVIAAWGANGILGLARITPPP